MKTSSNQELLVSNMLEIQAFIGILERKGITNQDEVKNFKLKWRKGLKRRVKRIKLYFE